jgi:hypothetical protein
MTKGHPVTAYLVQAFDTNHQPLELDLLDEYRAPAVDWPHASGRTVATGCAAVVDGDDRTVLLFLHDHTAGRRADDRTRRIAYWIVQPIGRSEGRWHRGRRGQVYLTRYGRSCTGAVARIPFSSRYPPVLLPDPPTTTWRCDADCTCLRHYPARQNRKDAAA